MTITRKNIKHFFTLLTERDSKTLLKKEGSFKYIDTCAKRSHCSTSILKLSTERILR